MQNTNNRHKPAYTLRKIKVGTIGYFKEGAHRTAICEVIEIIGLLTNPSANKI